MLEFRLGGQEEGDQLRILVHCNIRWNFIHAHEMVERALKSIQFSIKLLPFVFIQVRDLSCKGGNFERRGRVGCDGRVTHCEMIYLKFEIF